MKWDLFKYFRRITSGGRFIPEIDGLRFIAIALVIIYHYDKFIVRENHIPYIDQSNQLDYLHEIFLRGYFGVDLFFVISGFILALPFANYYIHKEQTTKPVLKDYYWRRVTRLEPPYFLALLLFFYIQLHYVEDYPPSDLKQSFWASLFYSHWVFFDRSHHPLVNNVIWSLEIEIQFYLLAPFIFKYLFNLKNRRKKMLIGIWVISTVSKFWKPDFYSLYEYFHFFLMGILLADLYTDRKSQTVLSTLKDIPYKSSFLFICCLMIWLGDITYLGKINHLIKVCLSSIQLFALFLFMYLILFLQVWNRFFTNKIIIVLGGMCYTIYLLHNQIILGVGFYMLEKHPGSNYTSDYFYFLFLCVAAILLASIIFFSLIERPCMIKDWPNKIIGIVRRSLYKSET